MDNPAADTVDACQGTQLRRPPLDYTTNESGLEKTTVAGAAGREGGGVAKPDPRDTLARPDLDDIPISAFVAIMPPIVRLRLPDRGYAWPDIVDAAYRLSRMTGDQQAEILARLRAADTPPSKLGQLLAPATPPRPRDPLARLKRSWNAADPEIRQQFLSWLRETRSHDAQSEL